jgi:hypothetical protein
MIDTLMRDSSGLCLLSLMLMIMIAVDFVAVVVVAVVDCFDNDPLLS